MKTVTVVISKRPKDRLEFDIPANVAAALLDLVKRGSRFATHLNDADLSAIKIAKLIGEK